MIEIFLINRKPNMSIQNQSATGGKTTSAGGEKMPRKVVIRRLPPSLSKEQFLDVVAPLPEHDYLYFCESDPRFATQNYVYG